MPKLEPYYVDFSSDSEYLVIAINCHNSLADRYEWEDTFLDWDEFDFKKLYLFDRYSSWFGKQSGGISGWAKTVARYVKKSKAKYVIVIGASMGGYGALVIGSLINADCVLAFVPQTKPTKRWPDVPINCRKILEKRQDNKTVFNIYFGKDNRDDVEQAKNLFGIDNINFRPVKSDQHKITKDLVRNGIVKKAMRRVLQGNFNYILSEKKK